MRQKYDLVNEEAEQDNGWDQCSICQMKYAIDYLLTRENGDVVCHSCNEEEEALWQQRLKS